MKKILILMLASALLLSSCGGRNDETGDTTDTNNSGMNDTLGDETGNDTADTGNMTETESDTTDDTLMGDETVDEGMTDNSTTAEKVTSVTSAEEAVTFIDVNVYSQCADYLPMSTMSTVLPLDDMDIVTYNTGLTDTTGITDIIISESMIGSHAYSLVMVRTDGTNTDEIQTTLGEKINPQKWVCVWAEQIRTVRLDNDIVLVMSDLQSGRTDPIMDAVVSAAEGVYEDIGSVVNVLG